MKALLDKLLRHEHLDAAEAGGLLTLLCDPDVPDLMKAAVLVALRSKGETPAELRGMAVAMRAAAQPFPYATDAPLLDTCGTGGDGSHAINISTAAALVLSATGLPVVKHGNRSVSSKAGSADVLEALGIALPADPDEAAARLAQSGFTFLFAPVFHPAMAAVVPVRRALGVRTVFNLLGPLSNPAGPRFQLLGAYSEEAAALLAGALSGMDIERAYVVHGFPHWDEATPMGPFHLWDVHQGSVRHDLVDPEERFGIPRCEASELAGGTADDNAAALRRVFAGERGAPRDAVVLNAALGLELVGAARGAAVSGRQAVEVAAEAIDSGSVTTLLTQLGV